MGPNTCSQGIWKTRVKDGDFPAIVMRVFRECSRFFCNRLNVNPLAGKLSLTQMQFHHATFEGEKCFRKLQGRFQLLLFVGDKVQTNGNRKL